MTFEDNKILDIKVTRSKENKVLADSVYKDLKDRVIQTNSVDLDAISGATVTSEAFLKAIEDAAAKAGVKLGQADKSKLKKKIDALPLESTYDVVVIGADAGMNIPGNWEQLKQGITDDTPALYAQKWFVQNIASRNRKIQLH